MIMKNKITKLNKLYGSFNIGKDKYFYKIVSKESAKLEIQGYSYMRSRYPVANLIGDYSIDNQKSVLIYDYEITINQESGLLVDLFANQVEVDKQILSILSLYKKIFIDTLRLDTGKSSDILFKSRIKTRLTRYYDQGFIRRMEGVKLIINGNECTLHLKIIIESIEEYFRCDRKTWCVLSQCDPGDLNIGTKPVILDYLAGGFNPVMAEFATFYWYQLAMNNYFALKYNPKAYLKHKKIYKQIDKVFKEKNKLNHNQNSIRKSFTKEYIDRIINPIITKTNGNANWYKEFKNYLAMRILCVFDVTKMSRKDMMLSLGYLQLFYDQDIKKPEELIKYFKVKK